MRYEVMRAPLTTGLYFYDRHNARLRVTLSHRDNRVPVSSAGPGVIFQVLPSAQQDIFTRSVYTLFRTLPLFNFNFNYIKTRLDEILDLLKDSTIAVKGGKDVRSRFWDTHRRIAEEREGEFLERHNSEMDIVLVFVWFRVAISNFFHPNSE